MALIDIVIVSWNSGHFLHECLTALAASSIADRLNVIVIDNASTAPLAFDLTFPSVALKMVHNTSNRGFAVASNQGARMGAAPFVLFLNPDVNVDSNALESALKSFEDPRHSRVGVVGIRLLNRQGETSRSCARRPTALVMLLRTLFLHQVVPRLVPPHFLTEWDHDQTREVDQVMGAFLMIRRDLFERLGGFDERFFLYYEDLDLCLRVLDAEYRVVHFAEAAAIHEGGGTTGQIKDRRFYYEARSRVLFAAKHHGTAVALLLAFLISVFEIPLRAMHALFTHSIHDGCQALRGGFLFWRSLPQLAIALIMTPSGRGSGAC